MESSNDLTLERVFEKGFQLHCEVTDGSDSDSSSESLKSKVGQAIMLFEDATRMVSALDLFSSNERVSELPTNSLKYLLLPAMLGDLNSRLLYDPESRLEDILVVEAYYKDFLRRINSYEVIRGREDFGAKFLNDDENVEEEGKKPLSSRPDLTSMNRERNEKIARYKARKALASRVKELKISIETQRDEETVREYYTKLIEDFAFKVVDELESYQAEKQILEHMKTMIKDRPGPERQQGIKPEGRKLKPVIITRDKFQKEVFGMGYKNLPVLSIEEFYEQRVRDGWFPSADQVRAHSLMSRAMEGGEASKSREDNEDKLKEDKLERDDPEELSKLRSWDEYKDDHKRGEGNRYNMG